MERRIGLLFATFLALLALGATKAAWLGVVKAGTLKRAAVTQQEADVQVPARRGSIVDDNGIELAVSEPAMDVVPRHAREAARRARRRRWCKSPAPKRRCRMDFP